MSTEMILRTIDDVTSLAQIAIASKLTKLSRVEEAAVILMTGRELGLQPMQSLRGIYVVEGKPTLSADMMVAVIRGSGLCESWRIVESTAERCTITTRRKGEQHDATRTWTKADATLAGVAGKDTWRKYPAAMLRHRCAADLARQEYPDVLLGLYDPDELGADAAAVQQPSVVSVAVATPTLPAPPTWADDLARSVADKVGKALERLSQYEWARKHPSDPMKRLGAVHAWACEMMSKADHLEHNQRVVLERGRDALIQAQEYMRLAVRMILRDNVTGEHALTYDRANDAVGDALVVLCDNVLRDKKPLERRGTEPVLTRREAARRAYDALTSWLYNTAECPFDGDGARRQDLPPEATAAMYRAAWAIGHCVMRDSDSFSQVARGAVGLVREHVVEWVRSARL